MPTPEENKQEVLTRVDKLREENCRNRPELCFCLSKLEDNLKEMDAAQVLPAATVKNISDEQILSGLEKRAKFSQHFYQVIKHRQHRGSSDVARRMASSLRSIRKLPLEPNTVLAGMYDFSQKDLKLYGIRAGGDRS